ncbi:hypothetical protein, partial [Fischerella thermalis]|uniref:hypothetical protein n=1 Tax=Fischerella thermalis TaxID=372787 RepID=UPI001CA5B841
DCKLFFFLQQALIKSCSSLSAGVSSESGNSPEEGKQFRGLYSNMGDLQNEDSTIDCRERFQMI